MTSTIAIRPVGYLSENGWIQLTKQGGTVMLYPSEHLIRPNAIPLYTKHSLDAAVLAENEALRNERDTWEKRARDYGWPDCGELEQARQENEALRAAASQASFCLRTLLPNDPDAQMTIRMLDAAMKEQKP